MRICQTFPPSIQCSIMCDLFLDSEVEDIISQFNNNDNNNEIIIKLARTSCNQVVYTQMKTTRIWCEFVNFASSSVIGILPKAHQ